MWKWENSTNHTRDYYLEPSDIACDSYNRYEEDFDLAVELNNNAIRISIEWARLEPTEGKFDEKEFEHYKKVLTAAKERNLKTYVTLHHFTNPVWFSDLGGWTSRKSPFYFSRYAKKCAQELGDLIDAFLTINEPQVILLMSYATGKWPPNKKNPLLTIIAYINLTLSHRSAYDSIKAVSHRYKVGPVMQISWYEDSKKKLSIIGGITSKILYWFNCDMHLLPLLGKSDFIGINYYFTNIIRNVRRHNPDAFLNDMGWWINPEGMEKVLVDLKRFKLPIYVTENGLADSKDRIREEFIKAMLIACARAIKKGAPLEGYFHWSLLDNFEWHHGFWPRFGLVEIDRENNLKRIPRKSFAVYAKICKTGKIEW